LLLGLGYCVGRIVIIAHVLRRVNFSVNLFADLSNIYASSNPAYFLERVVDKSENLKTVINEHMAVRKRGGGVDKSEEDLFGPWIFLSYLFFDNRSGAFY
jgi:hypothetical protein